MKTEQFITECKSRSRQKLKKTLKTFQNWMKYTSNLTECNENDSQRQVPSAKCLHEEIGVISQQ